MNEQLASWMEEWTHCMRCPLGEKCRKHAPLNWYGISSFDTADIIMVGEGPGEAEDILGRPFVGPAGKLLHAAISAANPGDLRIALVNLVVCRPQDVQFGRNRVPFPPEIEACAPHLSQIIEILNPTGIVCLGKVPQEWVQGIVKEDREYEHLDMYHPSYVLRSGGQRSRLYPKYVEDFKSYFKDIRDIRLGEPIL